MKMLLTLLYALFTLTFSFTHAQSNETIAACHSECLDGFDTAAICGVNITREITEFSHVSSATNEQRKCMCSTRGFVRSAINCLNCLGLDYTEWEGGCVSSPPKGLTGGAIAGIVVGCVFVVGILAFVIYYKRSKKRKSAAAADATVVGEEMEKMERGSAVKNPAVAPTELHSGPYGHPAMYRELDGELQRAELPDTN